MAQQWKSQTAGMKVEVHLKVNKHTFYILSVLSYCCFLCGAWTVQLQIHLTVLMHEKSSTDQYWKCQMDVVKVEVEIKGEQMKVLHSVWVYLLGYCFRCCAWSVQFQSHLTILVLMEDPQLTNIKSAGQITCAQVEKHLGVQTFLTLCQCNLVTLCYYHSTTSWLLQTEHCS